VLKQGGGRTLQGGSCIFPATVSRGPKSNRQEAEAIGEGWRGGKERMGGERWTGRRWGEGGEGREGRREKKGCKWRGIGEKDREGEEKKNQEGMKLGKRAGEWRLSYEGGEGKEKGPGGASKRSRVKRGEWSKR